MVENPPANVGDIRDAGWIPELGRFPGGGMATHFSILAWGIPWTEESDWLVRKITKNQTQLSIHTHIQ